MKVRDSAYKCTDPLLTFKALWGLGIVNDKSRRNWKSRVRVKGKRNEEPKRKSIREEGKQERERKTRSLIAGDDRREMHQVLPGGRTPRRLGES